VLVLEEFQGDLVQVFLLWNSLKYKKLRS